MDARRHDLSRGSLPPGLGASMGADYTQVRRGQRSVVVARRALPSTLERNVPLCTEQPNPYPLAGGASDYKERGDKGDGKRSYRSRQMLFFSCLVLFPLGLAFWLCFSRHLLIMRTSS